MKHIYDETTGKRVERRERPVVRPAGCLPPCESGAGCAKGVPSGRKGCRELSPKNWKAYQHYRECVAVGDFPRDATVRKNAAIIRLVEESAAEIKRAGDFALMTRGRTNGR